MDGVFKYHAQPFQFGALELQGLRIFLASAAAGANNAHAGNCAVCHQAPDFSDFGFHSNGRNQRRSDWIGEDLPMLYAGVCVSFLLSRAVWAVTQVTDGDSTPVRPRGVSVKAILGALYIDIAVAFTRSITGSLLVKHYPSKWFIANDRR